MRGAVPRWLLDDPLTPVEFFQQSIDVGMVQRDSLEMDLAATLEACKTLYAKVPAVLERELSFIQREHIELILGDIPPLCFEIAAHASIPSVAITNFTWDWIYRTYLGAYPRFGPIVEQLEGFYSKAGLALTLPYPCDMQVFPRTESIPWIVRKSRLSKREAREKIGLPQTGVVVLLSFGGLGVKGLSLKSLETARDFFFVGTGKRPRRKGNVLLLAEAQRQYVDLVRAADAIVTKPGYGIVADAISHQVPVLYTDRGDFPEYPRLVEALNDLATADFIAQEELLSGNLIPYLTRLLAKQQNWPQVALDGAPRAAEKIIAMIDEYR